MVAEGGEGAIRVEKDQVWMRVLGDPEKGSVFVSHEYCP